MAFTRDMYDYGSLTSFRSLFQRWLIIHSEFFNMWNLRWPPKCHISIQFFGRCRFLNNQRKHCKTSGNRNFLRDDCYKKGQFEIVKFFMHLTMDKLKLSSNSNFEDFLQVFFSHFWLCIFLPKNCQLYWLGNKVVPSIHNGSPSITRTCWHR